MPYRPNIGIPVMILMAILLFAACGNLQFSSEAREFAFSTRQWQLVSHLAVLMLALILVLLILLTFFILRTRKSELLRETMRVRDRFFINITHELRTPLTVILGLSEQLLQQPSEDKVITIGRTIHQQGEGLMTLVSQLLDIAKVQSQVGRADWRRSSITAYIQMIVDSYRDYAEGKHINLQYGSREEVVMDFVPDYLKKVMDNLLANAFKFTPAYGTISVLTWREDGRFFIDVKDTGCGMSEEAAAHVFEPFFQVGEGNNHGTGIGLALVFNIVKNVEGTISVDSGVGEGTTFHISFPLTISSRYGVKASDRLPDIDHRRIVPAPNPSMPADTPRQEGRIAVLVVEDNHAMAAYIGGLFDHRYAVSYAADGVVAMEKAERLIPDIIVTDLMMPRMDGKELTRRLRENVLLSHIPIVMITARATEQERIEGLKVGADAYITKPFNRDVLLARVDNLLRRRRLVQERLASGFHAGDGNPATNNDTDRRFLLRMASFVNKECEQGHVDVPMVAAYMCMSERQLQRKLQALTGLTPSAFILQERMNKARRLLLQDPELTISQVATRCGFDNNSNFSRSFRKTFGRSPSEERSKPHQ